MVHVPDLALNDDTLKVGFGLWNRPAPALGLEAALLFSGMYLYARGGAGRRTALVLFGLAMLGMQVYVFFRQPPPSGKAAATTALAGYAALAIVARLIEGPRRASPAG